MFRRDRTTSIPVLESDHHGFDHGVGITDCCVRLSGRHGILGVVRLGAAIEERAQEPAGVDIDPSGTHNEADERRHHAGALGTRLAELEQGRLGGVEGALVSPRHSLGREASAGQEASGGELLLGTSDELRHGHPTGSASWRTRTSTGESPRS